MDHGRVGQLEDAGGRTVHALAVHHRENATQHVPGASKVRKIKRQNNARCHALGLVAIYGVAVERDRTTVSVS